MWQHLFFLYLHITQGICFLPKMASIVCVFFWKMLELVAICYPQSILTLFLLLEDLSDCAILAFIWKCCMKRQLQISLIHLCLCLKQNNDDGPPFCLAHSNSDLLKCAFCYYPNMLLQVNSIVIEVFHWLIVITDYVITRSLMSYHFKNGKTVLKVVIWDFKCWGWNWSWS